jgi:hypothetical protein
LRAASIVLLVGSILFFVGFSLPAFRGFFEAETLEEQIAHIEENFTQFRLAWVLAGAGTSFAGAGLWMWGRSIAQATRGRSATAAGIAAWLGAVGVPNGVIRAGVTFGSASTAADPGIWFAEIPFVIYTLATAISMVTLGWLMIRGALPTWLGVVFILFGIAAVVTFLPLFWYAAGIIGGIAVLWRFRRRPAEMAAFA